MTPVGVEKDLLLDIFNPVSGFESKGLNVVNKTSGLFRIHTNIKCLIKKPGGFPDIKL
jgi:hypothetical protein